MRHGPDAWMVALAAVCASLACGSKTPARQSADGAAESGAALDGNVAAVSDAGHPEVTAEAGAPTTDAGTPTATTDAAQSATCPASWPAVTADVICTNCPDFTVVQTFLRRSITERSTCGHADKLSPLDAATARQLGFGAALDLIVGRCFEAPFLWSTPAEMISGQPAAGYQEMTTVKGQIVGVELQHVQNTNAICPDFLGVTAHIILRTGDGALAIEGDMKVSAFRGESIPAGTAQLNLNTARGSLKLFPPPTLPTPYGYVNVSFDFWPKEIRGQLTIYETQNIGTDQLVRAYYPLEARWPVDHCRANQTPLTTNESFGPPPAKSAQQLRDQLQGILAAARPTKGHWKEGGDALVTVSLGQPTSICATAAFMEFDVPTTIVTDDRRIDIAENGHAYVEFNQAVGTVTEAVVDISHDRTVTPAEFPQVSGISGIDFGPYTPARWYAVVTLISLEAPTAPSGHIQVDVADGNVFLEEPITTFDWP